MAGACAYCPLGRTPVCSYCARTLPGRHYHAVIDALVACEDHADHDDFKRAVLRDIGQEPVPDMRGYRVKERLNGR